MSHHARIAIAAGRVGLLAAAIAFAGCATVHVYSYAPRRLPAGSEPLAVINWSLGELENVSWGRARYHPLPGRVAHVGADGRGVAAIADEVPWITRAILHLTYGEIAGGVRAVTSHQGTWTVIVGDGDGADVELQFRSLRAARLFLDAASTLALTTG